MKAKLFPDILVYIISPIVLCNIIVDKKMDYIIATLILVILMYTFIIGKKEYRINFSGIFITFVYISFYLFKQNLNTEFERYSYDTCLFILISIFIVAMKLINVNIIKNIYIDVLRAKGYTKTYIWNTLKNDRLSKELEKTLQIIVLHIMSMAFVKVYSIVNYGIYEYKTTLDLEILICILFTITEIYMISKIIKINKEKNNKIIKIKKNNKENVIYLNKYKRTTK